MSGDGAHLGVSASRAIDTILGGAEQPAEDEQRNPEEMRAWLLAASGPPFPEGGAGYEEAARYAGKVILELFLAEPELARMPADTQFDWPAIHAAHDETGRDVAELMHEHIRTRGLDEFLHPLLDGLGLSGFQYGWAVNAARYCVELGPVSNPALLEIDTP